MTDITRSHRPRLAVAVAAPGRAASPSSCSGRITAGRPSGIELRGFDLTATGIGCGPARRIVTAFLHEKLVQRSERCAGAAQNPPFRGCRIEDYTCRAAAPPPRGPGGQREICEAATRAVRFQEIDSSAG